MGQDQRRRLSLFCSKQHSSWTYPEKSYWGQFIGKETLEEKTMEEKTKECTEEGKLTKKEEVVKCKINVEKITIHLPMNHLMFSFLFSIYASVLL